MPQHREETAGRDASDQLLPGVLVLGVDSPISLGIVRELGRHGVPVHGIGSRNAIGKASRYLSSFAVRADAPDQVIEQLKTLSRTLPASFVMTVAETDIDLLNRHRDALLPLIPLVPRAEQFEQVVAKDRALEAAESLGIRTPRTCMPTTSDTATATCDIDFPVVLKWPDPNAVQQLLADAGLAIDKARYCLSKDELQQYLAQYDAVGQYPLVQEYCRGVGLGHFVYMHNGHAVRTFQHLRLREWPPEGGTSTACLSLDDHAHPDLLQKSIALLAKLGWEGVAMVEYRYDALSGEAVFMEINGRFWGSFPLAVASGAQFAWLQYNVMGLGRQPTLGKTKAGLRCRFMLPEIRRLFRVVAQPGKIRDPNYRVRPLNELWTFLRDFFRWRSRYFVFTFDDPGPFFADLRSMVEKLVTR